MDTSTKSEKNENEDFPTFPEKNPKSYLSKIKQNNYAELSGKSFNNIYNINYPPDPQIALFPGFPKMFCGKSEFFRTYGGWASGCQVPASTESLNAIQLPLLILGLQSNRMKDGADTQKRMKMKVLRRSGKLSHVCL